jgi:hypothetical protein
VSLRSTCISDAQWVPAHLLWRYHHQHQRLRTSDAAIVLGSHETTVSSSTCSSATCTASCAIRREDSLSLSRSRRTS